MQRFVGIDFGTTNSAVAVADADGAVRVARYRHEDVVTDVFRSVLFFARAQDGRPAIEVFAGPAAIAEYLGGDEGRLMQSFKSFLPSRLVDRLVIFDRAYAFVDVLGSYLQRLRAAAEQDLGPLGDAVVVGRPVEFVKESDAERDELALQRLRDAFRRAGFSQIAFQYEPVAAALAYQARLERPENVLVGDFGGGTSDFCVMTLRPGAEARILSTAGVPIAGDCFDGQIVRHAVAPWFGLGSRYSSSAFGQRLEVPSWIFRNLERWHHLSFLRDPDTMHLLREILATSDAPVAIAALMCLARENLGFQLYQAVERVKVTLSSQPSARLRFDDAGIEIDETIDRASFERWIAYDVEKIRRGVDEALARSGLGADAIQRVFLTGGTSFVPAVRRIFTDVFGEDRLSRGSEFTSVAYGLAACARLAPM